MRKFCILTALAALLAGVHAGPAAAQGFQRWFQVEMTIFSNESRADRERELWRAENPALSYPPNMIRLRQLSDSLLLAPSPAAPAAEPLAPELARLRDTGPFPARGSGDLRLPDPRRDPFLRLPPAHSDFRQTNQAIERASQYRVLYNAVWRQPIGDEAAATPIHIAGGDRHASATELQGSIALYFNANRDRVIFSAELWLAEFGGAPGAAWPLPRLPAEFEADAAGPAAPAVSRVYPMRQQRELRSGEFHYIDHPAFGIVAQITPYERPAPDSDR